MGKFAVMAAVVLVYSVVPAFAEEHQDRGEHRGELNNHSQQRHVHRYGEPGYDHRYGPPYWGPPVYEPYIPTPFYGPRLILPGIEVR
jgi:hypothetical protein